ncbi:hypothetical protein FB45DRAFT_1102836 [Roridomyces roridus]|uniref:Uncharacterized protein n=1 Tax=Roridomyces roridus TaxID=1738132 RepID=A0AAD7CH01_9AGAR|nr:hypothetical protein FB45DRAFT_1102836 [Roridomyces roridus]
MHMRDEFSSRPFSTTLPMPGDIAIVLEHLRACSWPPEAEEPDSLTSAAVSNWRITSIPVVHFSPPSNCSKRSSTCFGGLAPKSTFLNLLGRLLERSGTCPLTIEVSVVDLFPAANRALQMLIEHAGRWENVCGPLETFRNLGELSLLEVLMLADDEHDESDVVVFEAAPRLKNFQFLGKARRIPANIPWSQLEEFFYEPILEDVTHLFDSMNLIPRITNRTKSLLYLDVEAIDAPVTLPPIVSDFSSLYLVLYARKDDIKIPRFFFRVCESLIAGQLLAETLTELQIEMRIADEELIQCLGTLPLLNRLLVSDLGTQAWSENVLVTDNLLRRFRFADDVYWDFLVSCLESGKKPEEPFQARLFWLDSEERRLSSEIRARIHALVSQRLLGFDMGRDTYEVQLQEEKEEE